MEKEDMTKEEIEKLPYRNSVSCVVYKGSKFLLVQLIDWPDDWWKFPQGGMEDNESEEAAAQRELLEEIGTDKFKIVGHASHRHKYDWTMDSIEKAGFRWRGQIQRFLLVEFFGTSEDIQINQNEVQRYKWAGPTETLKSIDIDDSLFVNYRRAIEIVLEEFGMN